MMGFVDVHLETGDDTACTSADTFYPLVGVKYIHESSGDWSLASNRLRHRGRVAEVYQVSVQIVASCGGGCDATLALGTWNEATQGVTMHDDYSATATISTSSVRPIMLTGILSMDAGTTDIELFLSSDTSGRTISVQSLTIDLIQVA